MTGIPLAAIHKAIEYRLIRPKRVREGNAVIRLLSKPQVLFLFLEAKGLRLLPLPARREIARTVERDPSIDMTAVSDQSVVFIQLKSARTEVETSLQRLFEAEHMVESNPEILRGTPVYRGTRIPVHAISEMLRQGEAIEEILTGYPALTRRHVELAPLYVKAFPRRGWPAARPWSKKRPHRITRHPISGR